MKFINIIACILMMMPLQVCGQIINTIAGDGTLASGGDGGLAVAAYLYRPWSIGVDSAGRVYTVETGKLRMISTSGIITTIAGTGVSGYSGYVGPATSATLGNAFSIVFDKAGNIYIGQSSRIRKIDALGIITTVAGTGTNGYGGDGGPATAAQINIISAVATDDIGNIYIADRSNHRLRKVNTAGIITTVAGTGTAAYSGDGGPATLAELNAPYGVATDRNGNIYFTDGSNKVRKIEAATGIISSVAGSGAVGYSGDGGPATLAAFRNLSGIVVDDLDNIYIGDAGNNVIRKINTAGIITAAAGTGAGAGMGVGPMLFSGDGGSATAAELHQPNGVDIDDTGNIYIADNINNRLRKVSSGNHLPFFAGGHTQSFSMCTDSVKNISTMLGITDADTGQALTWTLMNAPHHGTAAIAYSSTSTGGAVATSGLTYTPNPGYTGNDTMRVRVGDGISADFTTFYITVAPCTVSVSKLPVVKDVLELWPNPSPTGIVNMLLSSSADKVADVVIRNIVGEKIEQMHINTNEIIPLPVDMPAGIYFIYAVTGNSSFCRKLVLTK